MAALVGGGFLGCTPLPDVKGLSYALDCSVFVDSECGTFGVVCGFGKLWGLRRLLVFGLGVAQMSSWCFAFNRCDLGRGGGRDSV